MTASPSSENDTIGWRGRWNIYIYILFFRSIQREKYNNHSRQQIIVNKQKQKNIFRKSRRTRFHFARILVILSQFFFFVFREFQLVSFTLFNGNICKRLSKFQKYFLYFEGNKKKKFHHLPDWSIVRVFSNDNNTEIKLENFHLRSGASGGEIQITGYSVSRNALISVP